MLYLSAITALGMPGPSAARPAVLYAAGLLCILRPAVDCAANIAGSSDNSKGDQIKSVLSSYEIISTGDVEGMPEISSTARQQRHTSGGDETGGLVKVQFTALARRFILYLTPDTNIYAEGFEAWSISSTGSKKQVLLSDKNIYTGHVYGEIGSRASLYWLNRTITAKIETADETYYIEPAKKWFPEASSHSLLAYRLSDIRTNGDVKFQSNGDLKKTVVLRNFRCFCCSERVELTHHTPTKIFVPRDHRSKRETPAANSCSLLLIADYSFFTEVTHRSERAAILFMISMANKVDKIFRRTKWSNGWTNLGFTVRKVLVHTNWSSGDNNHYNAERNWTHDELLRALKNASTHTEPFTDFCLVHLFTGHNLHGRLGAAFLGIPDLQTGICAHNRVRDQDDLSYENVGFSTQFGRGGRRLLESEAETLLAHELGHGWGSDHDPNTTECSPDPNDLFIMAETADPHPKQNAKLFSPCSVRSMTTVIERNSHTCFEVDRDPTRGNYRIDIGEECDAGIMGDRCCGSDFKLNTVDTCSDANHICCQNCSTTEAEGRICQFESQMHCRAQTACDGVNLTCPIAFREIGSICFPDGSGRCLPQRDSTQEAVYCATVCETLGFTSCRCSDASNMCKLCCQQQGRPCSVLQRSDYENAVQPCANDTTKHCRRYDELAFEPYYWPSDILARPTDSPCLLGYCSSEGVCKKLAQDAFVIQKFFLSFLSPSKAVQFMRDNIVGTIIVFSLMLWIPASVSIKRLDRLMLQEQRRRLDSFRESALVSPRIAQRRSSKVARRPSHLALPARISI